MKSLLIKFVFLSAFVTLAGCARNSNDSSGSPAIPDNPAPVDFAAPFVVKARAVLQVSSEAEAQGLSVGTFATNTTVPVTVVMSGSTRVTFDTTGFKIPTLTNDVLDFGLIKVTDLSDNNLAVCGVSGTTQCTKAVIRVYTSGVAGSGLWNAAAGYGLPINVNFNSTTTAVGLAAANAAIVQTATIAPTTHALRLAAFTPVPQYNVSIDFTNAGVGTYSTNLVIEYGLQ